MKNLFIKAAMCCLLALASGCQSVDLPIPVESEETLSHTISVEDAIENLKSFMKDGSTRAGDTREVSNVLTVKYKSAATRSAGTVLDCENLIYVANFEDEQGYAILAADDRIDEPVLAITDQGSLTDENVEEAVDAVVNYDRPIFEDYPMTGPGFFSTPETGDEVFMNPNTVNLYNADKDDTLVGNFNPECPKQDLDTDSVSNDDAVSVGSSEDLATTLCVAYALNSINSNRFRKPGDSHRPPQLIDDTINRDTVPMINPNLGDEDVVRYETIPSDWYIKESVAPMLSQFAYWHQDTPFNDFYPEVRKYKFLGAKKRASAGCFPLALAKIVSYFEHPYSLCYGGINVNWAELKRYLYPDKMSIVAKRSAASLLRAIDFRCDSWHFYEGTFTFPKDARKFFRSCGYSNVAEHSYSRDLSKQMLVNGKPFCIYAMPDYDITKSHCWNIDGYKVKEQKITYNKYVNNNLVESSVSYKNEKMVHCDFGWGSYCSGYYVSGIFDQRDNKWEPDEPRYGLGELNYNNYLHIMSYDL